MELTFLGQIGLYIGGALLVYTTFELIEELITIFFIDPAL